MNKQQKIVNEEIIWWVLEAGDEVKNILQL